MEVSTPTHPPAAGRRQVSAVFDGGEEKPGVLSWPWWSHPSEARPGAPAGAQAAVPPSEAAPCVPPNLHAACASPQKVKAAFDHRPNLHPPPVRPSQLAPGSKWVEVLPSELAPGVPPA